MNTKILVGFIFCVAISVIIGFAVGSYMNNQTVKETSDTLDSIDNKLQEQIDGLAFELDQSTQINSIYQDQILKLLNQTRTLQDEVKEWKDKYDRKGGGGSRIIYLPTPGY
jgi:predicted PurR-regulated permease PerM